MPYSALAFCLRARDMHPAAHGTIAAFSFIPATARSAARRTPRILVAAPRIGLSSCRNRALSCVLDVTLGIRCPAAGSNSLRPARSRRSCVGRVYLPRNSMCRVEEVKPRSRRGGNGRSPTQYAAYLLRRKHSPINPVARYRVRPSMNRLADGRTRPKPSNALGPERPLGWPS